MRGIHFKDENHLIEWVDMHRNTWGSIPLTHLEKQLIKIGWDARQETIDIDNVLIQNMKDYISNNILNKV